MDGALARKKVFSFFNRLESMESSFLKFSALKSSSVKSSVSITTRSVWPP